MLAQYAFRPGSGQPTLLWLDSVTTQRSCGTSVRSLSQRTAINETGIEDKSSVFLHGQLREETNNRSWTTFFPPKLSELASSGSVKLAGHSALQQYGEQNGSYQTTSSSFYEKSSKLASKALYASASALLATSMASQAQANPLEHRILNAGFVTETERSEDDNHHQSGLEVDSTIEMDALRQRVCGQHRQNFTLPTESWAIRSSGWRGLYFSGVGGGTRGGKRAVMRERWPRKRSTGTTMRIDDRRPDLRSAFSSDVRWPWTGLPSQPSKKGPGGGTTTGVLGLGGAVNRRLAGKASG